MSSRFPYCESIYQTTRRKTREVKIGSVIVGGNHPIRIQSMTTSNTRDVEATANQIIRLADVGCEIARVTVQGKKEAEACEGIKNLLIQKGYIIPVVADIHFYPPAAMLVVDFVDKVRINPGNYVDRRATFKQFDYNDESYNQEILRIEEGFSPLVQKCKKLGRAMRIGTNHGSLSDRIMSRYGDTTYGMVESALEFARVCRKYDYHDFMFSMKASNPVVMIEAYRLLIAEMMKLGWDYPLHLGVTEAGEGEDGRVKSAAGIGTLLLDGLGDTIRVSLTEDPWKEIDPCKRLVSFSKNLLGKRVDPFIENHRIIGKIEKRVIIRSNPLHRDGSVFIKVTQEDLLNSALISNLGASTQLGKVVRGPGTVDAIFLEEIPQDVKVQEILQSLHAGGIGILARKGHLHFTIPVKNLTDPIPEDKESPYALWIENGNFNEWDLIKKHQPIFILAEFTKSYVHQARQINEWLRKQQSMIPLILVSSYTCASDDLTIHASTELGGLLIDGIGNGLMIQGSYALAFSRSLGFSIMQAARLRSSKTDFIACPGCGRTLFNLQEVTQKIKLKTAHLPGVKIAIMGCIVNGPGEMADADFGYVGSKPNKIDLYVGRTCVERDIDFSQAEDRLIALIKAQGRWIEPASL